MLPIKTGLEYSLKNNEKKDYDGHLQYKLWNKIESNKRSLCTLKTILHAEP